MTSISDRKRVEAERIAADVQEFKRSGGKIEKLAFGDIADKKLQQHMADWVRQESGILRTFRKAQ